MNHYSPELEQKMVKFYLSLDEASQRRYAAIESSKLGHGGKKYIKELLGTSYDSLSKGALELEKVESFAPTGRIRKKGGGRKGKKTIGE
jgi:hypothetical protein